MGTSLSWAEKMAAEGKVVMMVYYWVCNNRHTVYNNTPKQWVKKTELYRSNISVSLVLSWYKSEADSFVMMHVLNLEQPVGRKSKLVLGCL